MTTISGILFGSTVALQLGAVEWGVIALYAAMMIGLGLYFSRAATKSADGFLIGERSLPWWVIGFANVATYSDSGGRLGLALLCGWGSCI